MSVVLAVIGVPFILIAAQPDVGTAMVFSSFLLLMYREGMPGWILALVFFSAGLFLVTLLASPVTVILTLVALAFAASGFYMQYKRFRKLLAGVGIYAAISLMVKLITVLFKSDTGNYFVIVLATAISALVFLIIASRKKLKYLYPVIAILAGSMIFTFAVDYVFDSILKPHQQTRVNILLGKETDVRNVGYNLNQSKIAIGSGGFLGKGFLNGTQTKLNFVPEQSTDLFFVLLAKNGGLQEPQ
jgi:rod shape determining protein RodA